MTRRFTRLAWAAAACTYLLIVLGAVVRVTGSGLGCGEHWPRCHGRWFPPFDDIGTLIEWNHRLFAGLVTILVVAVAGAAWWMSRRTDNRQPTTDAPPAPLAYVALGLLITQVLLGAVVVKLALPPWTVVLHLGTAMLLLATLLGIATQASWTPGASPGPVELPSAPLGFTPGFRPGSVVLGLAFVTVLLGALTANLGAASACLGFPLCNGQLVPAGNYLQHIQWTHRLLAYTLFGYAVWWAWRTRAPAAWGVVALVTLQVAVAAAMVLLGLPRSLQAIHVALGAGVWAWIVITAGERAGKGPGKGEGPLPLSPFPG